MDSNEFKEVEVLDSKNINKNLYWKIKIDDNEQWVIRKLLKDLRPIISNHMKKYFNIPTLPLIQTKQKGRTYQLFLTGDPFDKKIITFDKFLKKEPLTDDIIKQARSIYIFRQIFQIKTTNDSDIIVIQENYRNVLYSINEPMENINKKGGGYYLSDSILNKWFKNDDIHLYIKKYLCKFVSPYCEISFAIDQLEEKLTQIVRELDKNYIWYVSSIINEQILFCSK